MRMAVTGYLPDTGRLAGMDGIDNLFVLGGSAVTRPRTDRDSFVKELRGFPCRFLHIDGEYDDYDFLGDHPAYPWNGGLAQTISRDVMRLCRGQVFTIGGKTVLALGGGTTAGRRPEDKYWDWWPEQDISEQEEKTAFDNLRAHGDRVDIVLTYGRPSSWGGTEGRTSDVLEEVRRSVDFGHWYFYGEDGCAPSSDASAVGERILTIRRRHVRLCHRAVLPWEGTESLISR